MDKAIFKLDLDSSSSLPQQRETLLRALRAQRLWDLADSMEPQGDSFAGSVVADKLLGYMKKLSAATDRLNDSLAEHLEASEQPPSAELKEAERLAQQVYDVVDDVSRLVHAAAGRSSSEEAHSMTETHSASESETAERWVRTYGLEMFEDQGRGEATIRKFLYAEIGVLKQELHEWRVIRHKTPWEFVPEMLSRNGACEKLRSNYETARRLLQVGTEQLSLPFAPAPALGISERREQLLRFLVASARSTAELAELLGVSSSTVLRDVHWLQSRDVPLRLSGSGVSLDMRKLAIRHVCMSPGVLRTLSQGLRALPLSYETITSIVEARRCLSQAYCAELSLALDL